MSVYEHTHRPVQEQRAPRGGVFVFPVIRRVPILSTHSFKSLARRFYITGFRLPILQVAQAYSQGFLGLPFHTHGVHKPDPLRDDDDESTAARLSAPEPRARMPMSQSDGKQRVEADADGLFREPSQRLPDGPVVLLLVREPVQKRAVDAQPNAGRAQPRAELQLGDGGGWQRRRRGVVEAGRNGPWQRLLPLIHLRLEIAGPANHVEDIHTCPRRRRCGIKGLIDAVREPM